MIIFIIVRLKQIIVDVVYGWYVDKQCRLKEGNALVDQNFENQQQLTLRKLGLLFFK